MFVPSEHGEELCKKAAAHPKSTPFLKSKALSMLGYAVRQRGEDVKARSLFEEAVAVCERAGGQWLDAMDQIAVEGLVHMSYEGLGGLRDMARGDAVHAHGVRLRFGPSLEFAAERAARGGNHVTAMEYWTLAAEKEMPRAISIVEGIPLAEAERRVDGRFGELMASCKAGSRILVGSGSRAPGAPAGTQSWVSLESTMPQPAVCSGCGRKGRFVGSPAGCEAELEGLSVKTLRARLTALGVHNPPGTAPPHEKADLVAQLATAWREVAAQPVLLGCSRCRSVFYCSQACQRADWAKHKPVCINSVPSGGGVRKGEAML
jgi:hypothetical protein